MLFNHSDHSGYEHSFMCMTHLMVQQVTAFHLLVTLGASDLQTCSVCVGLCLCVCFLAQLASPPFYYKDLAPGNDYKSISRAMVGQRTCVYLGVLLLPVLGELISGNCFITIRADAQEAATVCFMQCKVGLCDLLVA